MQERAYREYLSRYRKRDGDSLKAITLDTYCADVRYVERALDIDIDTWLRRNPNRRLPPTIPSGYRIAIDHYRSFIRGQFVDQNSQTTRSVSPSPKGMRDAARSQGQISPRAGQPYWEGANSTNKWNIHDLMLGLSSEHPIFQSEADLQHALAWRIHTLDPNYRVRLEARVGGIYVDLWLPDNRIAVELKFAKGDLETHYKGEKFCLPQGAWDSTAHHFMHDIVRLEWLVGTGEIDTGFAVLLSNEPKIWTPPNPDLPNQFDAFRLHEEQPPLAGQRNVADHATDKIKRSHPPVALSGSYPVLWRPYSNLEGKGSGLFRYLAVEV